MKAAKLSVEDLSWSSDRGAATLLHSTSFSLDTGRVLGIVGPNGAGKTTLLRLLYRFYRPTTGTVRIDGDDIWSLSAQAVARRVAAVLQEQPSDFALTVGEIVALGRTPHRRGIGGATGSRDKVIVEDALDRLELRGLVGRHLGTLSGGERQRVMVARALAQEPRLLILDEPTNHLDIRHQLEVLDLIRSLPLTIVTSLHDLNLAAGVCDDVLLLHSGHAVGFGPPAKVLSEVAVSDAFQIVARKEQLSLSNTDHLTFHLQKQGSHS
ncbi:iron complex transport system ATP-binding protein [Cribrihabitans marinus]|uniref:Iron complex transport system ATP-binding protein n=1 Tax=Cribrihabitans marinus TaxID=1227549 RepID=A0A1H6QR26_9RHOB|nr:ABC transporter ATP-binding protein [Cribrihabitans marinus]GGH19628.1 ABC transporter ATP-binding protein [Cribrihabitans marinus]SEI46043.1 iron complex transport system ATP-binding protein [Cribrihabitans marinus]